MHSQLRIGISSICFHRDIFPGSCFKRREYGSGEKFSNSSHHVYTLEPAVMDGDGEHILVKNQDAFDVTQWLEKGVFKALEDQYLDQLTFAIFTAHPVTGEDLLLETYEFKCTYPGITTEGKRVSKPKVNNQSLDKNALKSQANKFVRSLIEFSSSLEDVPEERWITIELAYTANCPPNYQPEYFVDNTGNGIGFFDGTDLLKIKIGNIKTDHHNLDVRFKGREQLDKESLSIFEDAVMPTEGRHRHFEASSSYLPPSQDDHLNEVDSLGRVRSRSCSSFAARAPALATSEGLPSPLSSTASAATTTTMAEVFTSSGKSKLPPSEIGIFTMKKSNLTIDTEMEMVIDGPPDSNHVAPYMVDSHQRVRKHILQQNRSVLKETAKALRLSLVEARRSFLHLLSEGFLDRGKGGSSYIIADREAGQGPLPVISPDAGVRKSRSSTTSATSSSSEPPKLFFRPERQERGSSSSDDDGSEKDEKMNQGLECDDGSAAGADSETQDASLHLIAPQNSQAAALEASEDERDSLSDQSPEYLPRGNAELSELVMPSLPLEPEKEHEATMQSLSSQSQEEKCLSHQEHRLSRQKRGLTDKAYDDAPPKKSRKTSIIARPVRMKTNENRDLAADLGSQLECYGYSSGQLPRSQ